VFVRIERLRDLGHELRRPEADILRHGIHELRATARGVHYRVLYFFHGQVAAVVAHGLVKEKAIPDRDINLAIRRKFRFGSRSLKTYA
jgi:phage-related protein